jgi:hypothetical protein
MSTKEDREKIRKKTIEEEEKDDCFPSTWSLMNDYTCTCSCGCQNPADDYVCHNCKIGMCKVGMKR